MIKFLKIGDQEAMDLASNDKLVYTPGKTDFGEFYFFKEEYHEDDELVELTLEQADGLLPVNPSKPIFKR